MKKIFLGFMSLFLVSILLLTGCTTTPTDSTSTNTQTPTQNTQVDEIESQQKEQTQQTETPKETIYSMNQDIEVDYITYKITKAETFTEMGTSMFNKETEGKFVKVYLRLTNNAQETKQIFTPRFKIEDSKGRKYDRISDDMMYIADYLEFGKQLQPGLGTSGAIVFELPKDSENLKLVISGDWVSTSEVKVELSSIQDIGKDTTQKDEQDEMMDEAMADAQQQMDEMMQQYS